MKIVLGTLALSIALAGTAMSAEEPPAPPKTETVQKAVKDTTVKENTLKDVAAAKPATEAPWITNKSGLKWRDKYVGTGTEAKMNMPLLCHYTLWLADSTGAKGKLVQTSKQTKPFQCTIGVRLIQGWSEGMIGMKEGGTRELIIPPAIGYGGNAMGDMIPANSTLYFEIEFLNEVKK